MSTILKALRRLDEQRRSETTPRTLEEQVLLGGGAGRAPHGRKIWLAGGALGVLAVAGASALWLSREEPPAAVATAQPERVAAAPPPLPEAVARAPRESLPARGAPITGDELDTSVRSALRPQPTRGELARAPGAASALPAAGNQPEPGIGVEPNNSTAQREPAAATTPARETPRFAVRSAREEPRTPAPAPAPAPQRELAPSSEQPQRAPLPEAQPEISPTPRDPDPSAQQQTAAPSPASAREQRSEPAPTEPEPDVAVVAPRPEVWVESTEWHPSPEKRSARIRIGEDIARNLREGDAVGGVIVKEIRPSAVLFLHEGAEFKRGVGGS
ncbi:MAG TPA: hypothetical protein VFT98_06785 [Myxococcota bacterium]|nr:hypothetical protein [Myxococcota bacterium]